MKNSPRLSQGFSLIETTMALGISAFALVTILGLIPVGLNSVRNAREQSAAGNVLSRIVENIRFAKPDADGKYTCIIVPGITPTQLNWSLGDGAIEERISGVAWDGTVSPDRARFVVRIAVTPPPSAVEPGRAEVSVVWPPTSAFKSGQWENANGRVETAISFLPKG